MYVARNSNNDLYLYDAMPFLQINRPKRIIVGKEELQHDCFFDVYEDSKIEFLEPFWSIDYAGLNDIGNTWYRRYKINNGLFPEVTLENGVYDLDTMKFVSKAKVKQYTRKWKYKH